ncbi:MAG: DegT/DnrJ/EryC1/StrS family aminotransferase [Ilumatobacteraceae bacterium]
MIPITTVRLGQDVEALVLGVLRTGMIAQGPLVRRLEVEFAALIGVDHVVAVNNGTTALIAALHMLDLQPGDEVITSPFTFVATLNAIIESGATVRFADIRADDFNIDPGAIAPLINERTKVVLPVHLYGQCADMARLGEVTADANLAIVEDAAQAHGARIGERSAGSWGIGCFSLYATKNLTTAEGGLISTNDDALADRLRVLRNQGMRQRYVYEMAGNNYRMTDLQAALCLPQLAGYGQQVAIRQLNAGRLNLGLRGLAGVRVPETLPDRHHVWHQYTILVDDEARLDRDALADALTEQGIGCGIYYPRAVFDYDCYREHPQVIVADVPVAVDVARRCLSLPVHQHLADGDIDRIVNTMTTLLGER